MTITHVLSKTNLSSPGDYVKVAEGSLDDLEFLKIVAEALPKKDIPEDELFRVHADGPHSEYILAPVADPCCDEKPHLS